MQFYTKHGPLYSLDYFSAVKLPSLHKLSEYPGEDDGYALISLPGRPVETETPFDEMFSTASSRTTGS